MDSNLEIIKLLTEIKEGLKGGDALNIFVPLITAGAAILGVLASGLIQHFTAKFNAKKERERQRTEIQVDLIAKQRQEWMDSIRNASADLLADVSLLYNETLFGELSDQEKQNRFTRIAKNSSYIELKLNVHKEKQKKAVQAIEDIKDELSNYIESGGKHRSQKFVSHLAQFKDALRDVFEETWQKIKKID